MHLKLNVNSQSYNINEDYGVESGGGSNNGRLPSSQLTKIQNDIQGNEEHLSIGAAIQFNKMVADAKKQGVNITLNDAYRVCGQPDDYVKYVVEDPYLHERMIYFDYDGKQYTNLDYIQRLYPHLLVRYDTEGLGPNPPVDSHPSKECHKLIEDAIIKKIESL